jgi:hypothetical protein
MGLWGAAAAAAGAGWGLRLAWPTAHPVAAALGVLSLYGAVYVFITYRLGLPEAAGLVRRLRRREPPASAAG